MLLKSQKHPARLVHIGLVEAEEQSIIEPFSQILVAELKTQPVMVLQVALVPEPQLMDVEFWQVFVAELQKHPGVVEQVADADAR